MIVLTLDIDWAPDFVIDDVAQQLIDHGVKATWFVTHESAAVDRLRARPDLFELGLHPNFMRNSTHGDTPDEVLRHCLKIVPDARSFRTHGLVQSTGILDVAMAKGLDVDLSLFLPNGYVDGPLAYWRGGRRLWRIPYVWEDDMEMEQPTPSWSARDLAARPGLQVLDFHPIHVWLNGPDMGAYNKLKTLSSRLSDVDAGAAVALRQEGAGPGRLFRELVALAASSGKSWRVDDVLAQHALAKS
jgi:hypothetical protein